MARKRMVTRTILGTEVNAITMTISDRTTHEKTYTLNGRYENNDKIMKVLRTTETDDEKIVTIISTAEIEKCFGMLESDFLKYAKELDLETRKELED